MSKEQVPRLYAVTRYRNEFNIILIDQATF